MTMEQLCKLEYARKKAFIEELGTLCCKYGVGNVFDMKYERDAEKSIETVTVFFCYGGSERKVNVSADSLPAMVRDIFRNI